uniref:Mediator of RNA polymerase II transcription subunit 13 n=1 Tax=Steinernema glaseri TaxID=37863 RepID=A0A1I7YQX5_9BILA
MSDDGQKTQGRQQRTDFFNVGDDVVINNQPLATGYYISTAPAADLPDWFWTCCPSARHRSPVHLRSSLHLTVTNSQSEEILKQSTESTHPLEATATEDVLRDTSELTVCS